MFIFHEVPEEQMLQLYNKYYLYIFKYIYLYANRILSTYKNYSLTSFMQCLCLSTEIHTLFIGSEKYSVLYSVNHILLEI